MLFNSIEFLLFFPLVFIVYWLIPSSKVRHQNLLLLVASYIFYGWWDWRFLSLIAFSTVIDYYVGLQLAEEIRQHIKKRWLVLSLGVNLGFLGVFKYYNFFIDSLSVALNSVGLSFDTWTLQIILPVGISFYTFQTLSYSIDIYKGKIKPTKDLLGFATFVCFFPQLVAGPIERAKHLLPQFLQNRVFSFEAARLGLTLVVYGFFKKVVIADRLAPYVNKVFGSIDDYNTIPLILAAIFFAIQIYCDFSGYSLIARGTAKLLGFDLMVNFKRPYLAETITDFWRRWHISLSTWFRDYLYIPLGGSRVSSYRHYYNLFIVFLVSGLWHGANWTFVVWGGLHGLFQIIYTIIKKSYSSKDRSIVRIFINILFINLIVCIAWIFFRADNVYDAFQYIGQIAACDFTFNLIQLCAHKGPFNLLLSFLVIGLLFLTYLLPESMNFKSNKQHLYFNIISIILIIILGENGQQEFIYFQF